MRRPQTPEALVEGVEMLRTFGAPISSMPPWVTIR
jgi:hypothetical protein